MPAASFIYMDHAATTPLAPSVQEAMITCLRETYGNPSSLHQCGKKAKQTLDKARKDVAQALGAQPSEMVFTSGATEADNLAIFGVLESLAKRGTLKGKHLITTQIEHAAVSKCFEHLETQGWDVTWLPVTKEGFVLPEILQEAICPDTVLASIIHGNNEMGTIQDIATLGRLLRDRGVLFHVDAVQTAGKLPLNLSELPVDYLALSAHKIYGPKGVGALYIRSGAPQPYPLLQGGGQEFDLRSGTENLAGIAGFAEALKLGVAHQTENNAHLQLLQKALIETIHAVAPEAVLNGPSNLNQRVPGNVHFSFPCIQGETLVLQLDLKGIAVSSGSACHSAVLEPSRIVKALGKSNDLALGTVRFSLGLSNTLADVQRVGEALDSILPRLSSRK